MPQKSKAHSHSWSRGRCKRAVSSGLNNMLLLRTPVTCIAIVIEYVLDPQLLKAEKKECRMLAIGHVDYPDYCFWLEHYIFFLQK